MRKVAAAALAVPVLAIFYLPMLARRSVAARLGLLASVGIVVIVAAFGLSRPVPTSATPPSAPITALADAAFRSIETATELHAPVDITFSEAMDTRSVAASLSVAPATAISTAWNSARTVLTVRPAVAWAAGTYHTITVAPGALAANGRPMANAVHAAFVTRAATSGRIVATQVIGSSAGIGSAFRITFDHPVTLAAVMASLSIAPALTGSLVPDAGRPDMGVPQAQGFTFSPATPLAPGTVYRLALGPLSDVDGAAVDPVAAASYRTISAPHVVRFRPAASAKDVARRAALSVRFSEAMDHGTTRAAFTVTSGGRPVVGTYRFAEGNRVLVFQPSSALPAGAPIAMTVAASATSVNGVPIGASTSVTFRTAAAPKPRVAPRPVHRPSSRPSSGSTGGSTGGSAVGGGSWGAVETYYLRLMNCTRTGGWVTSTGSCSSPGGRNVAPLRLDAGISSHVSRPYAKKLAVNGWCDHFVGGNPGDRLRAAGYTSYIWAENLGCRSGNPYSAVLGSHLYFQSEKPYNGGHYVNLMNGAYDRVGIGVWVSGGRVRLVVDFYHPR